ncbi:MAG: zf-HC2 domain-containing protein [Chloroflexi bacterium]|nr:zf-HC2 domain-containing protein [Chloroflexota bacterium]
MAGLVHRGRADDGRNRHPERRGRSGRGRRNEHPTGEALSAYVDGELAAPARLLVEQHLHDCPECRDTVAHYRGASDFFQRLPAQRAPLSIRRDLYRRIDTEQRRRLRWLPFPGLPSGLPLPSANAVGFIVTAVLLAVMTPQLAGVWRALAGMQPNSEAQQATAPTEVPFATPMVTVEPEAAPPGPAAPTATAIPVVPATQAAPPASPSPAGPPSPAATRAGPVPPTQRVTSTAPAGAAATAPAGPAASATAPKPTVTSPAYALRTIIGTVDAVDRKQKTLRLTTEASASVPARTWQVGWFEGTAGSHANGRKLSFEEVGIADHVEVTGFEAPQAGTLMASSVRVLVSAVPQASPGITRPARVLVLLDGADNLRAPQFGFTGDWIKRLGDTGYAVTALEPVRLTGTTNLQEFSLIVVGYPATLSDAALQAVRNSKVPLLVADPRLVQPLGLGLNVDPMQPTRSIAGKKVEVVGQASPVTSGFAGEVDLARDTLYRTAIVANGTVLAWINDGGRRQAVWSLTGNAMYLGVWWSNHGQNHNATYWTLFDRSVLYLVGRDPLSGAPVGTSAPAPSR